MLKNDQNGQLCMFYHNEKNCLKRGNCLSTPHSYVTFSEGNSHVFIKAEVG